MNLESVSMIGYIEDKLRRENKTRFISWSFEWGWDVLITVNEFLR